MIKIGICDDEKANQETIKSYLKKANKDEDREIDTFDDGKSLLEGHKIKKYDLIFMDVEMPGETGIVTAQKIREIDENVVFIFISAYPKYALDTYELKAFWFLEKPVSPEKFYHVFEKVLEVINKEKIKIAFRYDNGIISLNINEILYVRSKFRYLEVHEKNGVYEEIPETLKNLEKKLKGFDFVRINNNLIVNMKEIIDFGTKEVELCNGEKLEMSVRKRKECSRALKIIILPVTILGFFGASVLLKNSSLLLVAGCMICLILSFFYETTYLQRLFFITIFIVISGVTEILTIYIISGIGKIALENIQSISNIYFISALLSKLLLFCSVKVIIYSIKRKVSAISSKILIALIFFPISGFCIIIFLTKLTLSFESYEIDLFTMAVSMLLIFGNFMIFHVVESQTKIQINQQQMNFMNEQLKRQKKYYEEVIETQRETRKIWHDMKNKWIIVNGYMNNNEITLASKTIANFAGELESLSKIVDTGCLALDSVLNSKIHKGENSGCQFEIQIDLPENLRIDEMDLAILIGNILDNAIEGCENLEKSEKKIKFEIKTRGSSISIVCKNTVLKNFDVAHRITTKKDKVNHGFGLKNIKILAEKYKGDLNIKCENKAFSIQVFLRNGE